MKKAKDWVSTNGYINGISIHSTSLASYRALLDMIKAAQIDAIEATVLKYAKVGIIDDGQYHLIAEQLKKELENE